MKDILRSIYHPPLARAHLSLFLRVRSRILSQLPSRSTSTKQLFASAHVHASSHDSKELRQEMLDMKDIDKIHTSADGADSFMDKAKEEESTLQKLVLLHSHATTRLAQMAAGEKKGAATPRLPTVGRPGGGTRVGGS